MKDREVLEVKLTEIISDNNSNRKLLNTSKESCLKKGMTSGLFMDIWQMDKKLTDVSQLVLFIFTNALFNILKDPRIKPENFFTPVEIADGQNANIENPNNCLQYPLKFENVLKIKEDQYVLHLSIQEIKRLHDSKLIIYNYETQRNAKVTIGKSTQISDSMEVFDGELSKTINLNKASVKSISDAIVNGTFISNIITLNLLADGTDEYVYDNKRSLTVVNGQINIIDGYHRLMGMIDAVGQNPNLEYVSEVRFTNWNVMKCRSFIFQEDFRNKIDKRYLQGIMDMQRLSNKVILKLNESGSDIKGKIVTDLSLIKAGRAWTFTNIMSDSVEFFYNIRSNMEVNNISEWLGEFFDHLIGLYYDDFKTPTQDNVMTLPAMFVIYVSISSQLYSKQNWKKILKSTLSKLDFSTDNHLWTTLNVIRNSKMQTVIKKPDIKKISAYINSIMGG